MVFPWAVIGGAFFRAGVPLTWSTRAHGRSKVLSLSSPRARTGLPGICVGCWAPSVSPAPLTSLSRGMCLWPQGGPWQRMCLVPWGFNNVMLPNAVWRHPSRPGASMCIPKVLTSRVHEAEMYWATRLTIISTFHSHSISELEGTLRDHFQSPHLTEKGHPETSDDLAQVLTLLSSKSQDLSPGLQLFIQKFLPSCRAGTAESAFGPLWPEALASHHLGPVEKADSRAPLQKDWLSIQEG